VGLAANLVGGWLALRWSLRGLLAVALVLLASALAFFPFVTTLTEVYLYAAVLGAAGGLVTVVFFAAWGALFGPAWLGQIQGAAQMLTVLASAVGPLLVAGVKQWTGSYTPLMQGLAIVAGLFAIAAWFVSLPPSRGERHRCPAQSLPDQNFARPTSATDSSFSPGSSPPTPSAALKPTQTDYSGERT
jgi:MFS family permease